MATKKKKTEEVIIQEEEIIIPKKKSEDSDSKTKKPKKEKTKEVEDFSDELSDFLNQTKGISVESLSEREQVPYWLDTTNYAWNWCISNSFTKGIPGTKSIIIAGESSKGKSLLCDVISGSQIRDGGVAIKIEIEDAGGKEFTAKIVGDEKIASKIKIISPEKEKGKLKPITIEKLTSILNKLINFQISKKDPTPVIVTIDSVSQLSSDKEYEDIQKEKDKRDMTAQQKTRALFRAITQQMRQANLTIIGIAHMTANIGVMFGPKTVVNVKGSGFTYANSLTLEVNGNKPITDKKTGIPIGIRIRIKTTKNRVEFAGRSVWFDFYFHGGIDKYSGLAEILGKFEIITMSKKPELNGLYDPSTKCTFTHEGKEYEFNMVSIGEFIESWEEGSKKLLNMWEKLLNEKFKQVCERKGLTEADLISTDEEDQEELYLEDEEKEED